MWKISSLHKKAYGEWAGNPRGIPPDPTRCCEEVHERGRGIHFYQCSKPRGYGPEEAYCKIHDPAEVKRRNDKAEAKYREQVRQWKIEKNGPELLEVVQKIANGHNDAMGLAQETLTRLKLW
jgi:hypothetical protein